MSTTSPVHEITPAEAYSIDSDEFDSEDEEDHMGPEEYDRLVEEAESGYSEEEVKAMVAQLKDKGLVTFLREYLAPKEDDLTPSLRKLLLGMGIIPPLQLRHPSTPNIHLLGFTKLALSRILRRRERLSQYNTIEDALTLLKNAKNIIVLSGAGISTSCGIPDFRSSKGLYAKLQEEGKYDLDDPQQLFDIGYFREHPEVFYSFAKSIYPSNFVPSPCHRWIKCLEDRGVLLRNYTQNIDTLESLAGVEKVLQCHGSFKTASCLRCKTRVPGQTIEPYILSSQIPYCGPCREKRDEEIATRKAMKAASLVTGNKGKGKAKAQPWDDDSDEHDEFGDYDDVDGWGGGEPGIMKPDITFFGQALDSVFDDCLYEDREKVDLLVIIGTSLKVAPVSEVLTHIPHSVPQIYINLTPIAHVHPDICLIGDADTIVTWISKQLGWHIRPPPAVVHSPSVGPLPPVQVDTVKHVPGHTRIAPEEVKWLSGVGELSHIHMLSSLAEQHIAEQQAMTTQSVEVEVEVTTRSVQQVIVDDTPSRLDGEHGDSEEASLASRPAKRSRIEMQEEEEE